MLLSTGGKFDKWYNRIQSAVGKITLSAGRKRVKEGGETGGLMQSEVEQE